jgi:hypothetical protein
MWRLQRERRSEYLDWKRRVAKLGDLMCRRTEDSAMIYENVWPAGEVTSLQKKEKFSEKEDAETVPSVIMKARTSLQIGETWKREDKGLISYTKAITAFRIELNAEAEFRYSLLTEVSITNARQKIYLGSKHWNDCLNPLLRPGDQSRPADRFVTEASQNSALSYRRVLPRTQASESGKPYYSEQPVA